MPRLQGQDSRRQPSVFCHFTLSFQLSLRAVDLAFIITDEMTDAPCALHCDAGDTPLVLIVEDDPETRHFYSLALADGGFRTDEAHNGFQALEKALSAIPDLILTDIAVPGMDGIELCRRLRGDERTSAVPVLAITGYSDRRYPARAIDAGADHVLAKPCETDVLVREARRLIAESRELREQTRKTIARARRKLR
jgi:two-component system cell cycle response regulator DivK